MSDDITELRGKILHFNKAYEEGHPLVEDYIYDFYKKKLKLLEEDSALKISAKIGPSPKHKIKHLFKVLSLDHNFGIKSFNFFIKKLEKKVEVFPLIAEIKVDGVSLLARYENGHLKHLATRGDGIYGENITHLKDHLPIPSEIYLKQTLEIRFEAYINKDFIENPRNAVAGMLLKKEVDATLKHVKLAPHHLYSHENIWSNYLELREIFEKLHLEPIKPYAICKNKREMEEFFNEIEKTKENLRFEIDGIVFKINEKSSQEFLGNTATAPRFAFAIKFENESSVSVIKDIKFQVSRFGKITPVAEIEEVIIKGRKIKKATLNNFTYLLNNKYSIGDTIKIEMAGEVIPMISEIIEKGNSTITIPTTCPFCKSILEEDLCVKGWQCYAQKKERLIHFASKHGLDIQNMGEKQIAFFIGNEILNYPYDFFEIKNRINKIKHNPSWLGEKSLINLLEAIETSKYTNLEKWYMSLGLPHVGRAKAQTLAQTFSQFENFLSANIDELKFLGPEIAKDICSYKKNEEWIAKTWKHMKIGQEYKSDAISLF